VKRVGFHGLGTLQDDSMNACHISDRILLTDFLNGSDESLDILISRYENELFTLGLHISNSLTCAEEVLNKVFLRVLAQSDTLSRLPSIKLHVFQFALDFLEDYLERNDSQVSVVIELPTEREPQNEFTTALETAIQALPIEYRKAFVLSDVLGVSKLDASEILSISQREYSRQLHRARLMIRRTIRRSGFDHTSREMNAQVATTLASGLLA
jgi:DNA-directed RNA polymerase specialized sigma24 family protein